MTKTNNSINALTGSLSETQVLSTFDPPFMKVYTMSAEITGQSLSVNYRKIQEMSLKLGSAGIYNISANIYEDMTTISSCASANKTTYCLMWGVGISGSSAIDGTERIGTSVPTLTTSPSANNFGSNSKLLNFNWTIESPYDDLYISLCGKIDNVVNTVNVFQPLLFVSGIPNAPGFLYTFDIACSDDGKVINIADYDFNPKNSLDNGVTWIDRTNVQLHCNRVASSSDGSKVLYCQAFDPSFGFLWVTTDFGTTYTQKNSMGAKRWYGVAMSSDGTKMYGAAKGGGDVQDYIYKSADSGSTWTTVTSGAASGALQWWGSICCSSDGTKVYAATDDNKFMYSLNSGATFSGMYTTPISNYTRLKCSSDGGILYYCSSFSQNLYKSTNNGQSWSLILTTVGTTGIPSISISSNGQTVYAASGNRIYYSFDYGLTWAYRDWLQPGMPALSYPSVICCSSDGRTVWISGGQENSLVYGGLYGSHCYGGYITKNIDAMKSTITAKYIA